MVHEAGGALLFGQPIDAAAPRADPQVAGRIAIEVDDVVAGQAGRLGRVVTIAHRASCRRVEMVEPGAGQAEPAGPDPECAVGIREDRRDGVAAQALRVQDIVPEMGEDPAGPVKAIQPGAGNAKAAGAHPERSVLVQRQRRDGIGGDRGRIRRVVAIGREGAGLAIEGAQATLIGADPQCAGAVVQQRSHGVTAQAGGVSVVVAIAQPEIALRVEVVEPAAPRADPQRAVVVLV